jgi:glycosyltransferase involved in cell wall biosynthesis
LANVIAKSHPDVIVAFLETPSLYAELAVGWKASTKLVVSERSCDSAGGRGRQRSLMRQLHRLADFVTTNSHHQRESLEASFPWLRGRIATIWNGVDIERFSSVDPTRGLTPKQPKILVVSSVSFDKNGLTVIAALEILRDRFGLRPTVTWVGEHQLAIASRRAASEAMQAEIAARHLSNQWVWQPPTPDVPKLMASHDVLVHASVAEGLPNVICEALASGLPVVASRLLDHPRLVQDGVSGLLFEATDPMELAQALRRVFSMAPGDRTRMGRAGQRFAERSLSLHEYVSQYEQLFERVLASPSRGRRGAHTRKTNEQLAVESRS